MKIKQIKIPENIKTSTVFAGESKFIVINGPKTVKYMLLPTFLEVCKSQKVLEVKLDSEDKKLYYKFQEFNTRLDFFLRSFENTFKKRLTLKGLGYRINIDAERTYLEFKLGFSHLIRLSIPESIKVKIRKTILNVEGTHKVILGNFVNKIISLKSPDSYKGKGFWFKYQTKVLKDVKKKK